MIKNLAKKSEIEKVKQKINFLKIKIKCGTLMYKKNKKF